MADTGKLYPIFFSLPLVNTHQTESFLFWSLDVITNIIDDQSKVIFHKSFYGIGTGDSHPRRSAYWNMIYPVIFAA